MAKLRPMETKLLKPGMTVNNPILDAYGRTLLEPGTRVTPFIINNLIKRGIHMVYIRLPGGQNERKKSEFDISPMALQAIRKYRVEDPAKVQLESSVRLRILENVKNIYKMRDSSRLVDITNSIAEDLMAAVTEGTSLLVDINALQVTDEYTFKHSVDVAVLAMATGRKLGFDDKTVHELGMAGLLHDLGKRKIPDEILNKPAKLTPEEFEVIKKHPTYGYEIVQQTHEISERIALGVLQHHEKLNGIGYPSGLKGNEISTFAKILGIVDIYDALVTDRPYKKAKTQRESIELIMAMTNQLDIDIMRAFFSTMLLYPVDSIVKLSNGEYARVVRRSPVYILRPTVVGLESGVLYRLDRPEFASVVIL